MSYNPITSNIQNGNKKNPRKIYIIGWHEWD